MSGRAAVITDIHGNVPAVEAALGRIEELGVDAVYCGGDLVGYGPRPNEVCRTVEERAIPTIYGNYDYAIARDLDDCGCFYPTAKDREIGQGSVAWTLVHTDERSKRFMRDLPFDLRFELGSKRVHLVHGSPRKVNEYLLEDRPDRSFERIAGIADCDILLFGYTHKPWVREYGGVLFVNCGSVGKPKDGDARGSLAVLAASDGGVSVPIERVEYDARSVAGEIRNVGLPPELAEQLEQAAWHAGPGRCEACRRARGYPGRVDLARLRGRMPLVVFILLAVVCLALLGFACACLTDQPAQAVDRATSLGGALPPLVEVWSLVFVALVGASFLFAERERASSRASPAVLQRFLF